MITEIQKRIIQSCSDDAELYYYIFNGINTITQNNDEIIQDIDYLINKGYLECWKFDKGNKIKIDKPGHSEFEIYKNYNCKSFNEHLEKIGYGPHEFMATKKGINELK